MYNESLMVIEYEDLMELYARQDGLSLFEKDGKKALCVKFAGLNFLIANEDVEKCFSVSVTEKAYKITCDCDEIDWYLPLTEELTMFKLLSDLHQDKISDLGLKPISGHFYCGWHDELLILDCWKGTNTKIQISDLWDWDEVHFRPIYRF